MNRRPAQSADTRLARGLSTWVLGMIGSFVLVLSIPRLMRYLARTALPRLAAEAVWIALTGLLFEKLTDFLARDDE